MASEALKAKLAEVSKRFLETGEVPALLFPVRGKLSAFERRCAAEPEFVEDSWTKQLRSTRASRSTHI